VAHPQQKGLKKRRKFDLSLQISQRIIQLAQIRVQAVKSGTPLSHRFFRAKFQNGKIASASLAIR